MRAMRFGFVVPFGDAREFAEVAAHGERSGWDGVFTWEALFGVDAWVTLGAAAMVTERIRLGTMLTPVSRWRPWDLATRVGTVDRLSGGRAILGAGLGALHDGWLAFEADEGRAARAKKLDESLAVYAGLLGSLATGEPFSYDGDYYSVAENAFHLPEPTVQRPYPPVWLVGAYVLGRDRQPSLDRAARWQGLIPQVIRPEGRDKGDDLDEFATVVGLVAERRRASGLSMDDYDVVLEADSFGDFIDRQPADPAAWADAGATWWVESWWSLTDDDTGHAELRRRVSAGPPAG